MKFANCAFIFMWMTCVCVAEQAHEYLRVQGEKVRFFGRLEPSELPALHTESVAPKSDLDVTHIRKAVFDLVIYGRSADGILKVSSQATAFAVRAGENVLLAGSYHALAADTGEQSQFAILAKGEDGVWFHVEKFRGFCPKTDFVVMKPSRVLPVALALARDAPLPLDTLYTCGRLGRFSGVFRKGEMMAREESFFLSSLAAAQGSSGSPVLDKNGLLVGMVTDVVPILRESGLFSGDHFAEYVITRCRSFQEAPTTAHPKKQ